MRGLNLVSLLLVAVSGTNVLAQSSSVADTLDDAGLDIHKRSLLQPRMDGGGIDSGNLDLGGSSSPSGGGGGGECCPNGCFDALGDALKNVFCCGGGCCDDNTQSTDTGTGGTTVVNQYSYYDFSDNRRYGREQCDPRYGYSSYGGYGGGGYTTSSYGRMRDRPSRYRPGYDHEDHDDYYRGPARNNQQQFSAPPPQYHPGQQQQAGAPPHGSNALVPAEPQQPFDKATGEKPLTEQERAELDKQLGSACGQFMQVAGQYCATQVGGAAKTCSKWVSEQTQACSVYVSEKGKACANKVKGGLEAVSQTCSQVNLAIVGFCKPPVDWTIEKAKACSEKVGFGLTACHNAKVIAYEWAQYRQRRRWRNFKNGCKAKCRAVNNGCKAAGKAIGNSWQKAVGTLKTGNVFLQAQADYYKQVFNQKLRDVTDSMKAKMLAATQTGAPVEPLDGIVNGLIPEAGSAPGQHPHGEAIGYPVHASAPPNHPQVQPPKHS